MGMVSLLLVIPARSANSFHPLLNTGSGTQTVVFTVAVGVPGFGPPMPLAVAWR